jgi:hypothetical protein
VLIDQSIPVNNQASAHRQLRAAGAARCRCQAPGGCWVRRAGEGGAKGSPVKLNTPQSAPLGRFEIGTRSARIIFGAGTVTPAGTVVCTKLRTAITDQNQRLLYTSSALHTIAISLRAPSCSSHTGTAAPPSAPWAAALPLCDLDLPLFVVGALGEAEAQQLRRHTALLVYEKLCSVLYVQGPVLAIALCTTKKSMGLICVMY